MPTPRLALAHVLGSHGLGPQREVLGRILPHVGSMARMVSQLAERRVHCYGKFNSGRYLRLEEMGWEKEHTHCTGAIEAQYDYFHWSSPNGWQRVDETWFR